MNLYQRFKNKIKESCPNLFTKLKAAKKPFQPIFTWLRLGPVGYETIPTALSYMKRKMFPNLPSRYSRVKSLKDIHKGEKVFIVATGPSLTVDDMNKLKGHLCISMNSIVLSYGKTDWRPDYYVIIDPAVLNSILEYDNWKNDNLWHNIDPSHIVIPHYFDHSWNIPEEVIRIRSMRSRLKEDGSGEISFSGDCFERV